jgi:hypothetical protein
MIFKKVEQYYFSVITEHLDLEDSQQNIGFPQCGFATKELPYHGLVLKIDIA